MEYKLTPEQARQEWTKALRSGEYLQGHYRLVTIYPTETRYCCLGVACDLFGKLEGAIDYKDIDSSQMPGKYSFRKFGPHWANLPEKVAKWLSLRSYYSTYVQNTLSKKNDTNHCTFNDIANFIESPEFASELENANV